MVCLSKKDKYNARVREQTKRRVLERKLESECVRIREAKRVPGANRCGPTLASIAYTEYRDPETGKFTERTGLRRGLRDFFRDCYLLDMMRPNFTRRLRRKPIEGIWPKQYNDAVIKPLVFATDKELSDPFIINPLDERQQEERDPAVEASL